MNMFPIISALQEAQGGLIDAMFKCSLSELNTALHKAQLAINKHNRYLRFWRDTSYLEGLASQTKMAMMVATAYVLLGNKYSSIRDFFEEAQKKPENQLLFKSDTYEHNDVTIALMKGLKSWKGDVLRHTGKDKEGLHICKKYGYYHPDILRIKELKIK